MEIKMDILAGCNLLEYWSDIPAHVYFKMDRYLDLLGDKE